MIDYSKSNAFISIGDTVFDLKIISYVQHIPNPLPHFFLSLPPPILKTTGW
jgi:hypothetical protein